MCHSMDQAAVCYILHLLAGAAVQLFPSAAAALTCNVTEQPDGLFIYRLSQPPSSPRWETCWEIQNKSVIARDSTFDEKLVQSLTNQYIILKVCREDLHYTKTWDGVFDEVYCRVNCTLPPIAVNPHLTCISGSWCPEPLTVVLIIGVIVVVAAVVFGGRYLWKLFRCRRQEAAATSASYTPAKEQIKVEREEIDIV